MKIKSFIKKNKYAFALWSIFLFSTIFRAIIAGFPKHIVVLHDELIYYAYAENLAKGNGFPVLYQLPYYYQSRYLYSILISPAFLTNDRILQFKLIALINSIILNLGLFPTYLLSRDVLESKKSAIVACLIYIIMPDLAYSITFMADISMLPLGLWLIYFGYRFMELDQVWTKKIIYGGLFILIQFVAMWNKKASLLFGIALLISFLCYAGMSLNIHKYKIEKKCVKYLFVLVLLIVGFVIGIRLAGLEKILVSTLLELLNELTGNPQVFLKYYLYFCTQIFIAGGVFVFAIPFIYYRQYSERGKRLFVYMIVLTFGFTLAVNRVSMGLGEIRRVHLRYLMFIWMPFIVLVYLALKSKTLITEKKEFIKWGTSIAVAIIIFVFYTGPLKAANIEYTMLCWAENWNMHRLLYGAIMLVVLLLFLVFIKVGRQQVAYITFLVIWVSLQLYNNIVATKLYYNDYYMPQSDLKDIECIEKYIIDNSDKLFYLLDEGDDRGYYDYAAWNHLSSKVADTYLNKSNVRRVSLAELVDYEAESETGDYNMMNYPLRAYMYHWDKNGFVGGYFYDDKETDYIIVPKHAGASVDLSKCKKIDIGGDNWFLIYEIYDKNVIPHISSINYLKKGKQSFEANCGAFSSNYKINDRFSYISSNEKEDFVLYGPYINLQPGKYTITISYSYDGEKSDDEIGVADLFGQDVDPEKHRSTLLADENKVNLSIETEDVIHNFEIRVFAYKAGLKIDTIEIIYED